MFDQRKIRLLLWSPYGCGTHYCGPATYTHRVYSNIDQAKFNCSLVHGFPEQCVENLFVQQHCIGNFRQGRFDKWRFLRNGKNWFSKHGHGHDLFHAIGDADGSLSVASLAKKQGMPVVQFLAILGGRLVPKPGFKKVIGVYRHRLAIAKSFDAIIALSSEIEAELLRLGVQQKRIARIPNFADTDRFVSLFGNEKAAAKQALGVRSLPMITFAGRLCERKRPHLIVEAIGQLKERNIEVQCALVGPFAENDPYITRMRETIESRRLKDLVTFVGFTKRVEDWLQASDIFCLPSLNEGMPGALIEALSCGLPVVASSFSSAADVIDSDRIGSIVATHSPVSDLADAIHRCLTENQTINDFNYRRSYVESNFSLAAVTRMHEQLFQRVLNGKDAYL